MRLSDAQQDFALDIANLIQYINQYDNHKYSCTFGDAYRDPRSHGKMGEKGAYGRTWSAHKQRCAVDLNLFKDDQYQTTTKAFEPFGAYWLTLHPDNRWGGDWMDGNHFSRKHGGIA